MLLVVVKMLISIFLNKKREPLTPFININLTKYYVITMVNIINCRWNKKLNITPNPFLLPNSFT